MVSLAKESVLGWESADCDWQIWGRWTGYSTTLVVISHHFSPAAVGGVASSNFGFLQPAIGSDILKTVQQAHLLLELTSSTTT